MELSLISNLIFCRWLGWLGVRLLGWVGVSKPRPPPPETELEQTDFFRILIFLEDKKLLSGGGMPVGGLGAPGRTGLHPGCRAGGLLGVSADSLRRCV